jgi:hypothetical protein
MLSFTIPPDIISDGSAAGAKQKFHGKTDQLPADALQFILVTKGHDVCDIAISSLASWLC